MRTNGEINIGCNGITGEYPIMRHMCNLESVYTYEGTHEVHTLILGQHLTGEPRLSSQPTAQLFDSGLDPRGFNLIRTAIFLFQKPVKPFPFLSCCRG
jgi:hypothetical protein